MQLLLVAFTAFSLLARAEAPPAAQTSPIQLMELFDVEKQAGEGSIVFEFGAQKETITFGKEAGQYGLAMVFPGSSLPAQYRKDFKNEEIIQIAFGATRSKLKGQVPQFGAATLIASQIPTKPTRYKLVMPSTKANPETNIAFMLFTSPSTSNDRSDEEKLKGTLFAQGGSLTFTPKSEFVMKERPYQRGKMQFKVMLVEVKFDAELATPFNTQKGSLKGSVQLPLYVPYGKAAEEIARQLASSSLSGAPEPASKPRAPKK